MWRYALPCVFVCFVGVGCEQGLDPKSGDDSAGALDTGRGDTGPAPEDTGPDDTAVDADRDDDGLTDAMEADLGTDPDVADTDGDGLGDWEELIDGSDPLDPDTDGDGVGDAEDEDDHSAPDRDGDGLPDLAEETLGTDPDAADTDGDGLGDADELLGETDPRVADTDGDGLDDGDEAAAGTDPGAEDTDGDALTDGDEVHTHGTDPTRADSDGDGVDDAAELLAGSDATDASSVPGEGAGDVVRCDPAGLSQVTGRTFYDEAVARGVGRSRAEALYADWDGRTGAGTECACEVVLHDATPTAVLGASVWIPARVHDGTEWETEPIPAAVMIEPPATWPDPSLRYADDAELDFAPDDAGAEVEHWFGFDDIASNPDDEYGIYSATPFDVSGTYTVWVSYANTLGERMGRCDVLASATSSADRLHFRIDTPSSMAARFGPPAGPAVADALACAPGATATTRLALANLGEGAQPLVIGGSAAVVGAALREVRVVDWRGADRLELRRPGGVAVALTPVRPAARLAAPLALADARWAAGRASPGGWHEPVVEVVHTCPAGAAPTVPASVASVTWAELDAAARAATGGPGLELWREGLGTSEIPAVRAWIERGDAGRGDPDHLVLQAPGAGRLEGLVLSQLAADRWTFRHRRAGLALEGEVAASGADLLVTLTGGSVTVGGLTFTLGPASVLLLGGAP